MPRIKLTDRNVNAKRITFRGADGKGNTITLPPKAGTVDLWDAFLPGHGLRVSYRDRRTYNVICRIGDRQVRRRIGNTITHTLAEARKEARQILRNAERGIDSHSRRAREKETLRARQEVDRQDEKSLRAVAESWLADSGKRGGAKLRDRKNIEGRLENHVFPKLGALDIHEIDSDDIAALAGRIARRAPVAANRVLADLRRIFAWALRNKRCDTNPAAGIDSPGEETERERVLNDDEIARLWAACDGLGHPIGSIGKLLILTGARRNEVGGMRWAELENGNWILPSWRAKNGREHLCPLSTAAKSIIDATPHIDDSVLVFPAQYKGRDENGGRTIDKPFTGWGNAKKRLDTAVAEAVAKAVDEPLDMSKHALPHWTFHDLRRTLVTKMNEDLEIEPHIIEAVVGHVSGSAKRGIAGVYNRASYLPQRKAALERWAQHIEDIATSKADKVVTMKRKQRA